MSSFKGDSYYEAHCDDNDPDYRESSEEDSAESDIPHSMERDRAVWVVDNQDALAELYQCFKGSGVVLFGRCFYQLGYNDRDLDSLCIFSNRRFSKIPKSGNFLRMAIPSGVTGDTCGIPLMSRFSIDSETVESTGDSVSLYAVTLQ